MSGAFKKVQWRIIRRDARDAWDDPDAGRSRHPSARNQHCLPRPL